MAPLGRTARVTLVCALAVVAGASASPADARGRRPRWTAAVPDEMLERAAEHMRMPGADAAAGLAVAYALADRASAGRAAAVLAAAPTAAPDVAAEARLMALMLDPGASTPPGLLRSWAILGPLEDDGGGLARREGGEVAGATWGDRAEVRDRGAYQVRWREVPPALATARGVPLDALVTPRKESCSYLATLVTLPTKRPFVVRVAATGSVRLLWDTVELATSAEVHERLVLDRIAVRVEADAGEHVLAVKTCTGALADDGRVRVRLTDAFGEPLDLATRAPTGQASPPDVAQWAQLPTPLGRALGGGRGADARAALASAVARTLAGADDLRSPRAPGLLDGVARARATSPDELAMAGWVSPFGGARSAWLSAAVDRALAAGDSATASFAERRLVASRLSAGLADWAHAGLAREPLASARDPEARLLGAMTSSALGLDGLRRAALDELLALAHGLGRAAPVALWEQIAELADDTDPTVLRDAVDEVAARAPERRDARWVAARSVERPDAVARAAASAIALGLASTDEALSIGEALTDAGLDDDALAFFTKLVVLAPNRVEAWERLARALRVAAPPRDAEADAALQRARDLAPAADQHRAEAAFRAARTGRAEAAPPGDAARLVAPAVFLARRDATPAVKGEVSDRELHWLRVVTLHDDRRVSQLLHYAREIVVPPHTKEELVEEIPLEGSGAELLRARVHRAGGGVAFAEEEHVEGGHPVVRWPDLATGDVVEVAVRGWTDGPVGRRGDPPFYFVDLAGATSTHPLLYNEVVIDSPEAHPLAIDVLHGQPEHTTETRDAGRLVVRMTWEHPVNVRDEPLAPRSTEYLPTVVGSTFASWDEFRSWYQAAVEGFTEPDEQVRALARDLTRGIGPRDKKIAALFDFVADDIRYVNYVSGEFWLPNRPQQLLARRQGDCDDKALLLITLLRAIGVEATEVLVQTRLTGQPSVLGSTRAAVPLFDHGIAFVPGVGDGPGVWLDATSPESRLGPLPSMDARAQALFATRGPAIVQASPPGSPADHGIDGAWTVTLAPDGSGVVEADERHSGDRAFALRGNLREKDARASWVEQNLVGRFFAGLTVEPNVTFAPELARGAASVRWRSRGAALAHREGDDWVVSLAPPATLASQLAPLVTRALPVVLPPSVAPGHETRTVRIVSPEGWVPAELPTAGDEDGGAFGRARLAVRRDPRDPRAVVVERSVTLDASTIAVADYPAWRAFLQRADALMHRSVRFVRATHADAPRRAK